MGHQGQGLRHKRTSESGQKMASEQGGATVPSWSNPGACHLAAYCTSRMHAGVEWDPKSGSSETPKGLKLRTPEQAFETHRQPVAENPARTGP